jgi:DNA-binding CsgD family transcriptional regulator
MGLRAPDAARPTAPTGSIVVFSGSDVIGAGLAGLLPREWRDRIELCSDLHELGQLLDAQRADVIVDADAPGADEALRLARAHGGSAVLLLGPNSAAFAPELHDQADAIIRRDEADALTLRISLVVGRMGMRLLPRDTEPTAPGRPSGPPGAVIPEPGRRVLALLAQGMRDAEIARELNLSESAVRKLVQRTVRIVGARTRSQAVAIAARSGELTS